MVDCENVQLGLKARFIVLQTNKSFFFLLNLTGFLKTAIHRDWLRKSLLLWTMKMCYKRFVTVQCRSKISEQCTHRFDARRTRKQVFWSKIAYNILHTSCFKHTGLERLQRQCFWWMQQAWISAWLKCYYVILLNPLSMSWSLPDYHDFNNHYHNIISGCMC